MSLFSVGERRFVREVLGVKRHPERVLACLKALSSDRFFVGSEVGRRIQQLQVTGGLARQVSLSPSCIGRYMLVLRAHGFVVCRLFRRAGMWGKSQVLEYKRTGKKLGDADV